MNTDLILATLLHNNINQINKCIFIISPTKLFNEYYCKLFCMKNTKDYNNGKNDLWIRKYIMQNKITQLFKFNGINKWYTDFNFALNLKQIYNFLICSPILLKEGTIKVFECDRESCYEVYYEYLCLNICNQKLKFVPSGIFELINLRRLELNENKINIIPSEIINLKNLIILVLSENRLLYISKDNNISDNKKDNDILNKKLKKINMETKSFPTELSELTNLTYLDLSNNILFNVPPMIYELTKLSFLTLDDNAIDIKNENMMSLKKIEHLIF